MSEIGALRGILFNRCPRCRQGQVFGGLMNMNETCPNCGFHFEREPGYFVGAMFIQYMLSALVALPPILVGAYFGSDALLKAGIFSALAVVALSPFIFRYSRILWMYLDRKRQ